MPVDRDVTIDKILGYARRIAVVGLSDEPYRASFGVASYLLRHGYEIIPVNPTIDQVLGLRSYRSLAEAPGQVDVVDIFRRPEHIPDIARQAAELEASALWLQVGLSSDEARRIADEAGMAFVEDACLKVEVAVRQGAMKLPPEGSASRSKRIGGLRLTAVRRSGLLADTSATSPGSQP